MTRDEVGEYVKNWLEDEYALNYKDREVLNIAIQALKQKPKTGHWINKYDEAQYYICSQCGEVSCCMGNFCPDCGAKMTESKDEI